MFAPNGKHRNATPCPYVCGTLKESFRQKYPAYMNILNMFEAANLCDATWENLTKVRLQKFIDYMGERLSPNSVNTRTALTSPQSHYRSQIVQRIFRQDSEAVSGILN